MQPTLIRQILISFLTVCAGFALSWIVALYVMQSVDSQLAHLSGVTEGTASPLTHVRELLRDGQILMLILGLAGFLGGLVGMSVASNQTSRMLGRLKLVTHQLANVVLDQDLPESSANFSDNMERDIREMMRKIQESQQLCLDASPLTRLPGSLPYPTIRSSLSRKASPEAVHWMRSFYWPKPSVRGFTSIGWPMSIFR